MTFDQLYDKYYSRLMLFAFNLTKDELIAEEVVYDAIEYLIGKEVNDSYIYFHVKHRCINALKKKDKIKACEEIYNTFENTKLKVEVVYKLYQAIEMLPMKQKKAIQLFYFEKKTDSQIAIELKIARQSVKNLLYTARKKIKALWGDNLIFHR